MATKEKELPKSFNFNPDVYCEADMLGFDQYIKTLSGMITDPNFKTPFCIGIYGSWGMGKTSFMRLLAKEVSEGSNKPHVIPVWFNPWRYRNEKHLIVPFLKTIERAIKDYLKDTKGLGNKVKGQGLKLAKSLGRTAISFAHGTSVDLILLKFDTAQAADRQEAQNEKEKRAARTLADKLVSTYFDVVNELKAFTDESMFRIAVFIDDLDRCLPETVIELLESIKLFLDLPGYLFVIGVDKKVVEKGIACHYHHLKYEEEKDGRSKADDYLDKMIQFPLELPPVEAECKRCYIESLLSDNEEYKQYAGLIETGVGDNPRTLKRFVNLLAFISRHADTLKEKIIKDGQENLGNTKLVQQKTLAEQYFIPALYIKWALIYYKFSDAHKIIKNNRHRLVEMQNIAAGKLDEVKGEALSLELPEPLKKILKDGEQFPDDDWLLERFVHLARGAVITADAAPPSKPSASDKTEMPHAKIPKHQPGDMVLINKGSFLYGDEKRKESIDYDYYMDVFPVTNGQYKKFLDDTDHRVPYVKEDWAKSYNWDQKKRTFQEGKENHPVVLVSYEDAIAFCKWRTKKEKLSNDEAYRLPNEKEWEKAARGNDGAVYPWGDEFDKERCNTRESEPLIGGTTPVTKYPNGVSPFDCWDMAGNVWEWTSSSYYEEKEDGTRSLRGGSWFFTSYIARCAARSRYYPESRYLYVGFRCARTKK